MKHLNMTYLFVRLVKMLFKFPPNWDEVNNLFAQRHYGHIKIMVPEGTEIQRTKYIMCLEIEVG